MKRHPECIKLLGRCSQLNLTFNQVDNEAPCINGTNIFQGNVKNEISEAKIEIGTKQ